MHASGSFGANNLPAQFNFPLTSSAPVTQQFLARGAQTFSDALRLIAQLPYGRNATKEDILCPLQEERGTCSTKHALLKTLADEHDANAVRLMMGIYRMKEENTRGVGRVLEAAGLDYVPEAHVYLRIGGEVMDCTKTNSGHATFLSDLLEEREIFPTQIGDWKVARHRAFLDEWRGENFCGTLEELWSIREQCIAALSGD